MDTYDIAVIGAGPGGYVAAIRGAMRGEKACCIEANKLGGTCLNVGCIPTKAMLHASETYYNISKAAHCGLNISCTSVNDEIFMGRVKQTVDKLQNGIDFLLKSKKIDVISGKGKIVSTNTILVQTDNQQQTINAKSIIIATGSRPVRPSFLPWQSPRILTTDQATTAKKLPKSIIILGGGVIGCEFATIYSELGIPTTIVEMQDRLLPIIEPETSKEVVKSLQKRNVNVLTGTKIKSVQEDSNGITATLDNGQELKAENMLVSIGRLPNTENIGLEELGIELTNGIIKVDEHCRTNIPNIYAIGDVAETRQYAHVASKMGLIAADNAAGYNSTDDRTIIPAGVYCHPEIATVGLSELQAKQMYNNVKVSRFPYLASGIANAYGQPEGMVKIIGDQNNHKILGAMIIGPHATDTIHEIVLAMRNNLTIDQIAETIHAHPTFAEAIGESAEAWLDLPVHIMK